MALKKKIEFKIDESTGCYTCTSHFPDSKGYPRTYDCRKRIGLHRFIYQECFGEIPKGLVVRHKCDNRMCINPKHLELGTIADNNNDKMIRGRHKYVSHKGEKHWKAKLTEEDVIKIRKDNRQYKEIAKDYGVNRENIAKIKNYITWKNVVIDDE